MSLWKRGGVWWNYFYIDGVRHQISTGTSNKRQAEAIAQKQQQEANARRHQLVQADPHLTFGALSARFIASGIARPHHLYHLKILLPQFADFPVVRLTKAQAEEFRRKRQHGTTVKDATVNRDLSVLRHVLYWGVDEALLLANPLARLRMARERRTRRPVLSVEEEDLLLAAAPPHLRNIVTAALDTGMRRGEVLGQLWEHIDFPRRLLFVSKSKTPEGESREIPLTARLFDLLNASPKEQGVVFTYRGEPVKILKTTWLSVAPQKGAILAAAEGTTAPWSNGAWRPATGRSGLGGENLSPPLRLCLWVASLSCGLRTWHLAIGRRKRTSDSIP